VPFKIVPAVKKQDNNEVFKKYSLLVAINNKKCINYELYEKGAVNADRFNNFLKLICSNIKNKLIVLDNGQIHKKDSTKNSGNFLIYTCPYHPRLNAIVQWLNQLKHYIKLDKTTSFYSIKK
jgi:transposase